MRRSSPCMLFALALSWSTPAPAQGQDLLLVNANVVDVTSGSVLEDASVVVSGGRIERIRAGEVPELPGVEVVDLGGMFLAPGLIDAHVHVGSVSQARRALESGVTTMRGAGTDHYADVGLRDLAKRGSIDAPEYLAAGYHIRPSPSEAFFLDHPAMGGFYGKPLVGPQAVRAMARAVLSRGVDFVKTNATERAGLPDTDPRKQLYGEDELRAIVEEAGAAGIGVAAHAHGDAGARAAVLAGVRSIEHGTYLSPQTLRLMAERGTYLVPTIAIVRDLTIPGGDYDNAVLNMRGRHMLPRVQEMAREALRLGVRIVAATDTGYGPNGTTRLSHELLELVEIGMTPLQALQAATTVSAELLGVDDHTGRIAEGLQADLIVLERNPLDDIAVVQDVLMVVNDGKVVIKRGDWPGPRPVSND